MHDTEGLRNNVITIRQRCVDKKRRTNNSILFLKDFRNRTPIAIRKWQCSGRKDQLALENKSCKSCPAAGREGQRYEKNWKSIVNAQGPVSPMDKREDYLEAVKAIKKLATANWTAKQSSDLAQLPDSTEAFPITPSSRTAVELADMVHMILRRNPGT